MAYCNTQFANCSQLTFCLFECYKPFHLANERLNPVEIGHHLFFCCVVHIVIIARLPQLVKTRKKSAIRPVQQSCGYKLLANKMYDSSMSLSSKTFI